MRKLGYLWLLILLFACDTERSVSPDFNNYFVKYFGTDGNQQAVDAYLDTGDQTVMILGSSTSYDDRKQIYLAKVDYDGKAIWEKVFGIDGENPQDIEKGIDGNYIILSNLDTLSTSTIKLFRIDNTGALIDHFTYLVGAGTWTQLWGNSVTPISDGSYFVAGYTTDTETDTHVKQLGLQDKQDIIAFRFGSDFTIDQRYNKSLGGQTEGEGIKIFERNPTLFLLMGYSDDTGDSKPASDLNFYFNFLADSTANPAGAFTYGDSLSLERAAFAIQSPAALNNDYFVVGTQTNSSGDEKVFFTELFQNYSTQVNVNHFENMSSHTLPNGGGSADAGNFQGISCAASISSPPGFLITAHRATADGASIWLSKIDQTGTELWSQSFGFEGNANLASSVVELPDGKIFLVGTIGLNGQQKISLIKLNSTGVLAN